jgi:putative ABC transport system permease protein
VVRTRGNPLALASTLEETVRSIDKELPVFNTRSMDELMGNAVAQQRLTMALLGGFALLALVLAAVGIYGVMSYAVTQRTHEIGIRLAMGARPGHVIKLVIGQGMRLALVGIGIGLAASFGLTRIMANLLFGVSATDGFTFGGVALLLVIVALIACYIPARRAMKTDPMVALRYE